MKTETEVKIKLEESEIEDTVRKIEDNYSLRKGLKFKQKTHQFFEEDYTKQVAFPRIRNEEDGSVVLTVKVKIVDTTNKEKYFRRIELETIITDMDNVMAMMPYFGYSKKVSWEKNRSNFIGASDTNAKFSLDETPMGFYLEIEGADEDIEKAIEILNLGGKERITKAYLGLWDAYRRENGIDNEDMLFT